METLRTDLSQDFLHVTQTFERLGQRLTEVAEQVRTLGVLPSEDLIDAITMTRRSFEELRAKAIDLVGLLGHSSGSIPEDVGSVKDLEALLQAVTEAQRKRAQGEKVRLRALTILDHILSLIHRDQPEFHPLGKVQAKRRLFEKCSAPGRIPMFIRKQVRWPKDAIPWQNSSPWSKAIINSTTISGCYCNMRWRNISGNL